MRIWPVDTRTPGLLLALLLAASGLLACCVQKGDLILPGSEEPPVIEATTPSDEGDEQEGESNDE